MNNYYIGEIHGCRKLIDVIYFEFDNASKFGKEHNLNSNMITRIANGHGKTHKNWRFGFVNEIQQLS